MKTIIILFVALFFNLQKNKNNDGISWNGLIKVNQQKIPIYTDFKRTKINNFIMNDTIKEIYFELKEIERKGSMFRIKYAEDQNEKQVKEGWIDSKFVGIYLRIINRKISYTIFRLPTKSSACQKIIYKKNNIINAVDYFGSWVKIRLLINGKAVSGWIEQKFTCASPYANCGD